MSHLPVDHHLRPLFRAFAAVTAVCLLVFAAVGLRATTGGDWFARGDWTALGVPVNRAFAAACLVSGALVLVACLVGRNLDRWVNLVVGTGFLVAGIGMLTLANTDLNLLNFSATTSSVSFVVGLVLLAAGLYGKVRSGGGRHSRKDRPAAPAAAGG